MADTNKKGQSLGTLFADLSDKTTLLIRQEITLAKQEVTEKLKRALKDVVFFAIGAFIAYIGLLALIAAAALGLSLVLPRLGGNPHRRRCGVACWRSFGLGGGQHFKRHQSQTGADH